MTLLYMSPRFLDHDTGQHPECAKRLEYITARLREQDLIRRCTNPQWSRATTEQISAVHDPVLMDSLTAMAQSGGGFVDNDTVVSAQSVEVARLAAGALCDGVDKILNGEEVNALCLVRPPGHHALSDTAMGFCLFNNIAIAAQLALHRDVRRVLVIDWDVHHGNGTQAIFYDEPRVAFFSVHRWPFYPGTGAADETGTGKGLGTTRNLPIVFGTTRRDYRDQVMRDLEDFAARMKPELVLVSAGFDAHHSDPVGSLGLEAEDFEWLTAEAVEIADTYADGRLVSALEGGYNPPALAECVATHLGGLLGDAVT